MDKMYARKAFKCSICDKEYENAMDRARCELACGKKKEEEARKSAEAKRHAEQLASQLKVDDAYDLADKLRDEHVNNYGVYIRTNSNISNATNEEDLFSFVDIIRMFM